MRLAAAIVATARVPVATAAKRWCGTLATKRRRGAMLACRIAPGAGSRLSRDPNAVVITTAVHDTKMPTAVVAAVAGDSSGKIKNVRMSTAHDALAARGPRRAPCFA